MSHKERLSCFSFAPEMSSFLISKLIFKIEVIVLD